MYAVIGILCLLVIIGIAVWYFMFRNVFPDGLAGKKWLVEECMTDTKCTLIHYKFSDPQGGSVKFEMGVRQPNDPKEISVQEIPAAPYKGSGSKVSIGNATEADYMVFEKVNDNQWSLSFPNSPVQQSKKYTLKPA